MPILVTIFVTVLNSYCSVCLIEGFFPVFAVLYHKIAKEKKLVIFKLNNYQRNFSIACAEQQRSIILV